METISTRGPTICAERGCARHVAHGKEMGRMAREDADGRSWYCAGPSEVPFEEALAADSRRGNARVEQSAKTRSPIPGPRPGRFAQTRGRKTSASPLAASTYAAPRERSGAGRSGGGGGPRTDGPAAAVLPSSRPSTELAAGRSHRDPTGCRYRRPAPFSRVRSAARRRGPRPHAAARSAAARARRGRSPAPEGTRPEVRVRPHRARDAGPGPALRRTSSGGPPRGPRRED